MDELDLAYFYLIDTSYSMRETRLPLVQENLLQNPLTFGGRTALFTFDDELHKQFLFEPDKKKIEKKIKELTPGGITELQNCLFAFFEQIESSNSKSIYIQIWTDAADDNSEDDPIDEGELRDRYTSFKSNILSKGGRVYHDLFLLGSKDHKTAQILQRIFNTEFIDDQKIQETLEKSQQTMNRIKKLTEDLKKIEMKPLDQVTAISDSIDKELKQQQEVVQEYENAIINLQASIQSQSQLSRPEYEIIKANILKLKKEIKAQEVAIKKQQKNLREIVRTRARLVQAHQKEKEEREQKKKEFEEGLDEWKKLKEQESQNNHVDIVENIRKKLETAADQMLAQLRLSQKDREKILSFTRKSIQTKADLDAQFRSGQTAFNILNQALKEAARKTEQQEK